jgi:hypothetical protein
LLLIQIFIWGMLGYVGGTIAARKGYPPIWGVILGILLGPIGLLVGLLLPLTQSGREQAELEREINLDRVHEKRLKPCPQCGRDVAFTCLVCPRCDHRFAAP